MAHLTLDASALLALIQLERGGDIVAQHLAAGACSISAVNVSEVAAKLAEGGAGAGDIRAVFAPFSLEVHAFDQARAIEAGLLRPATRAAGLSFGDRACLSLALALGTPVLTADRAWASLSLPIAVIVVR